MGNGGASTSASVPAAPPTTRQAHPSHPPAGDVPAEPPFTGGADFDVAFRKAFYRRQAAADLSTSAAGAVLFAIAGTRLAVDGQWRNALLAVLCVALATAAVWLITYRTRFWCKHRDLLFSASAAAYFCVASYVASRGLNFLGHHGGSIFRLLFQISYANSAFFQLTMATFCRLAFSRMVVVGSLFPLVALPWGGRMCASPLIPPSLISRLYHRMSFAASMLNPLGLVSGSPGPNPSVQVMCCCINAHALLVCGWILPAYIAAYTERGARRAFLHTWRHSRGPSAPGSLSSSGGSGSSSSSSPGASASSSPSSQSLSALGSSDDAEAAAAATAATATTPPPLLGRQRHVRLRRQLRRLEVDPTSAAAREQEAVTELLRRKRPRALHWIAVEACIVSLLAWPLVVLVMEAGQGWLCSAS